MLAVLSYTVTVKLTVSAGCPQLCFAYRGVLKNSLRLIYNGSDNVVRQEYFDVPFEAKPKYVDSMPPAFTRLSQPEVLIASIVSTYNVRSVLSSWLQEAKLKFDGLFACNNLTSYLYLLQIVFDLPKLPIVVAVLKQVPCLMVVVVVVVVVFIFRKLITNTSTCH